MEFLCVYLTQCLSHDQKKTDFGKNVATVSGLKVMEHSS